MATAQKWFPVPGTSTFFAINVQCIKNGGLHSVIVDKRPFPYKSFIEFLKKAHETGVPGLI